MSQNIFRGTKYLGGFGIILLSGLRRLSRKKFYLCQSLTFTYFEEILSIKMVELCANNSHTDIVSIPNVHRDAQKTSRANFMLLRLDKKSFAKVPSDRRNHERDKIKMRLRALSFLLHFADRDWSRVDCI